ncbi:MAG: pyridoxal 5'-phosphate synthase glutaminase subunit PdxT [Bacteroidota bacterium]|nr:pyridoxal 5'-phosphate synthase glutaminase subunit PdxT [Bacteroidota bacterium]MDP4233342.1 pyridoxal 5'-phosphate synthase glutaminase subunit PdxT [Bacteroidota bacterium]MDP4242209.1 pyridoxal 5'-phosphate synthase glutaminase subunit PdxT [Bacteroidota bacterium]MDP4286965.1 pyridoxal 5'-phosphate synthase glutaminase subunit PdxT [Bacteroidota bacterium]
MASKPVVGVLGLQGDFREHIQKLESLGVQTREIRRTSDLVGLDALILPGGESTAVAILESSDAARGIFDEIQKLGNTGLPIWGTCMGSILLAKEIEGSKQGRLGLMDIRVRRNAFGPQRFSAETPVEIPALGAAPFPGVFIRAPLITHVGKGVEVLGTIENGIVMAREKNLLATVFHPEVVNDARVHEYFLKMIGG